MQHEGVATEACSACLRALSAGWVQITGVPGASAAAGRAGGCRLVSPGELQQQMVRCRWHVSRCHLQQRVFRGMQPALLSQGST